MKAIIFGFLTMMLSLALGTAQAGSLTIPNTFTADTPAKAEDVNANFGAVKTSVDDNASQIAALKAQIATLQSQLAKVASSNVMALDPYLTVDTQNDPRGPMVQFKGVNVQIVNGLGATNTINGLGNLIIGYDEPYKGNNNFCSIGTDSSGNPISDQTICQRNGGKWSLAGTDGLKTGSHYLVVGSGNNYSQFGGIVAGSENSSNNAYANVLGGDNNFASGSESSVSGGHNNTASGLDSNVSGGKINTASAQYGSVSGGWQNTASGTNSSVSGGSRNEAQGDSSSVSGGDQNIAGSTSAGIASSVSGGQFRSAGSDYNWAAGSYSATN